MKNKEKKMDWIPTALREVAEIVKGKKPSCSIPEPNDSDLAYLDAAFLRGQRSANYVPSNEIDGLVISDAFDTLILWDGANAGDIFAGQIGVVASTMARVRVTIPQVLPEFIYFCMMQHSKRLRETATGSTVPHVRGNVVDDLQIPLPPLPVQERIVQILHSADEIQNKRKKALDLAESILSSSFIAMFGNPSNNHDRFERTQLGELANVRSGVTKGRKLNSRTTVDVPYLRVANVQDGFLDLDEVKTIEVLPTDCQKHELQKGDILMTEGGDPDKLGRGCIWRSEINGCIHQNHIFRVRTDRNLLLPEYLAALLRTQYAKHYFLSCAKRSSNLASINSTQLKAFQVPVPSVDLQQKFVVAVEQWETTASRLKEALNESNGMFKALLHQAFSGELTGEWEASNTEYIADRQSFYERLPRLMILALLTEKVKHASMTPVSSLVTVLMKYTFLLQMEGTSRRRLYNFVPYHYGPFAKELYDNLEKLQEEGFVTVDKGINEEKIQITLEDLEKAEQAIAELTDDLKEDVATIIERYGRLDLNSLQKTMHEKYPAYAKKGQLRRKRKLQT